MTSPVEVISFRKGEDVATVAMGDARCVSMVRGRCVEHRSWRVAVCFLEALGYSIAADDFKAYD